MENHFYREPTLKTTKFSEEIIDISFIPIKLIYKGYRVEQYMPLLKLRNSSFLFIDHFKQINFQSPQKKIFSIYSINIILILLYIRGGRAFFLFYYYSLNSSAARHTSTSRRVLQNINRLYFRCKYLSVYMFKYLNILHGFI